MKVYQLQGGHLRHYFVKLEEWPEMIRWLRQHEIEYRQESGSVHGIGFTIRDYEGKKGHETLFKLKWLNAGSV